MTETNDLKIKSVMKALDILAASGLNFTTAEQLINQQKPKRHPLRGLNFGKKIAKMKIGDVIEIACPSMELLPQLQPRISTQCRYYFGKGAVTTHVRYDKQLVEVFRIL